MLVDKKNHLIGLVEWEDIIGCNRLPLPGSLEEIPSLVKHTIGYILFTETSVVVVSEFDVTNDGEYYNHNDYTIIPKGCIKRIKYLSVDRTLHKGDIT